MLLRRVKPGALTKRGRFILPLLQPPAFPFQSDWSLLFMRKRFDWPDTDKRPNSLAHSIPLVDCTLQLQRRGSKQINHSGGRGEKGKMRSIHLSATFFTFCRLCRALDEAPQPGITHFSWPVLRHSAALLGTHHYKCNTQLAAFPENCGKKWTLRRWAYGMFIARQLCSERLKLLLTRLASSHRDVTEAERAQRL